MFFSIPPHIFLPCLNVSVEIPTKHHHNCWCHWQTSSRPIK